MPSYEYRCKNCGARFALFFKTYADYDTAAPGCPNCASTDLAELISRVAIQKPGRDYSNMEANEMLSVLESGDSRQVGEMFEQIGAGDPSLGKEYHDATQKLLKGESMEKVERDLRQSSGDGSVTPSETSTPKSASDGGKAPTGE